MGGNTEKSVSYAFDKGKFKFIFVDLVNASDKMDRASLWVVIPVSYTHLDVYKRQD